MTYQTQESQAKFVIGRLKSAGAGAECIWIHTAELQPENKNPNKMNMIAHLLTPLTQQGNCRAFFLNGKDILLIGLTGLANQCLPYIDRIRRVLADDPFIRTAGSDFFTVYPIETHADLLMSALSAPMPAIQNHPADGFMYETVLTGIKNIRLKDVLSASPILQLTPAVKKNIGLLYRLDFKKIAHQMSVPQNLLTGALRTLIRAEVFKNHDADLYNDTPITSFIPFNPQEVTTETFDLFLRAGTGQTVICFSAESLLDRTPFTAALKKLHTDRLPMALYFENKTALPLMDFTKIKPDFVCVPYSDGLQNPLPAGLKAASVIVTDIETDKQLMNVLKWGYSLVQGKTPELILGALCQKNCPYGDTCAPGLCGGIWAGQTPAAQCVFPNFRTHYVFEERGDA